MPFESDLMLFFPRLSLSAVTDRSASTDVIFPHQNVKNPKFNLGRNFIS